MLTPKFTITQDELFVYVTIKVPHIRVSSAELITDGCDFSFYCKPYLLKLTFPHAFKEDDEECKATYDPMQDNGCLVAHLPKLNPGEHFPDLDLTTTLMQMVRKPTEVARAPNTSSIEVLSSEDFGEDWEAIPVKTHDLPELLQTAPYGFNNQYTGVFRDLREELAEMLEVQHPEQVCAQLRFGLRIAAENGLFDAERYLGDYYGGEEDGIFLEALAYQSFYGRQWEERLALKKAAQTVRAEKAAKDKEDENAVRTETAETAEKAEKAEKTEKEEKTEKTEENIILTQVEAGAVPATDAPALSYEDQAFENVGGFSPEERELLAKLPHREYLIDTGSDAESTVLLTLVDVLYAYCFDLRTTQGESTVESAPNIARLSAALSWLDDPQQLLQRTRSTGGAETGAAGAGAGSDCLQECLSSSIKFSLRRSVIYPYLRVWKLSRKVLADVAKILFLGRRAILKCLLHLRSLFEHTDTHYLLNKVFLDDYCVWVQTLGQSSLAAFAKMYNSAKTGVESLPHNGKGVVGFFLPELEAWADNQLAGSDSNSGGSISDTSEESSDSDEDKGGNKAQSQSIPVQGGGEIPSRLRDYQAEMAKRGSGDLAYLRSDLSALAPLLSSEISPSFNLNLGLGPGPGLDLGGGGNLAALGGGARAASANTGVEAEASVGVTAARSPGPGRARPLIEEMPPGLVGVTPPPAPPVGDSFDTAASTATVVSGNEGAEWADSSGGHVAAEALSSLHLSETAKSETT